MILSNRSQTLTLDLKIVNSIMDKTATHKFLGIIVANSCQLRTLCLRKTSRTTEINQEFIPTLIPE